MREHPPYTPAYEAKYLANMALRDKGILPDPNSFCGIPTGFPRILNLPDVYEFAVTPQQVWIIAENGPNVLRIYTDGRAHPALEVAHQLQDLRLDGDVERGGRLIGDQQLRIAGQRDGDHDPLAHAARKLVGICLLYTSPSPRD